jgi:hypothetical protein
MQLKLNQTTVRLDGTLNRPSQIKGFTKVLGGALLLLVLMHYPARVLGAIPGTYSVTLGWDNSTDPTVGGYRVYYGVTSGLYPNSVTVGNVTTATIPGLASGVTYYFAVTTYNTSGMESPFSNEIIYVPGVPNIGLGAVVAGQAVISVNGMIGHTYEIQATQDFKTWTVIGTITLGATGPVNFTDTNAANFSKRFYRTRDTAP